MHIDGRYPATPTAFTVYLPKGQSLALDDLVHCEGYYAVVEHVQKIQTDSLLDHTARVRVCRRVPEQWTAPNPDAPVRLADDEQLHTALYFLGS